jgi:uncharacterized membrane protein
LLGFRRKIAAFILWGLAAIFSSLTLVISQLPRDAALGVAILGISFMGFVVVWFARVKIDD